MTTITWTGAAGTDQWNNAANWSSGTVPGQNDSVIIGSASGNPTYTVTPPDAVLAQSITVYPNSVLNITSTIQVQTIKGAGGTVNFENGSSGSNINLNIGSGTINVDSQNVTFTQAQITSSSATLAINGLSGYSLSNVNISAGTLELNGTQLSGFSGSNVQNAGQIVLDNGSSMTVSNLQSNVTINGGSTLTLSGNYNSGAHVTYGTGTGNTLLVSPGASQTNLPISNVALGDKIGVSGVNVTSATYTNTNGTGSITLHTASGSAYTFGNVSYNSSSGSGVPVSGSAVDTTIQNGDAVICFLAGSMILTADGERAVEGIRTGDRVIAFDGNGKPVSERSVIWVEKARMVVRPSLPDDLAGWPVRVLKDAVAEGVPSKDMLITAEHCLFFEGRFVPARVLVNGRSIIFDKSIVSYEYYHVETEQHSVIAADGMLTESYLDTGNRYSARQQGNVVALFGDNSTPSRTWADAAAPLDVSRAFVEPLFRRIETRADEIQAAGPTQTAPVLTHDADLCLMLENGTILRRLREQKDEIVFMLPGGIQNVHLISRANRPYDVIGSYVDDRRYFGVDVGAITLFDGHENTPVTSHLTESDLAGWNALESAGSRWTTGSALLPLGERVPQTGALLFIQIKAAGPYILETDIEETVALIA